MAKKGRKSIWKTIKENLPLLEQMLSDRCTEASFCKSIGIGVSTFERYKKEKKELQEAIKRGKSVVVQAIESALYKSAVGFEYEETRIETELDKKTGKPKGSSKITKIKKQQPPQGWAVCFALKNLAPDKWKETNYIEGNVNHDLKDDLMEIINNGKIETPPSSKQ